MLSKNNFRRSVLVTVIASGLGMSAQNAHAVSGAFPETIVGAFTFNWSDSTPDAPWVGGIIADGNDSSADFQTDVQGASTLHVDSDRTIKAITIGDTTGSAFVLTVDATNSAKLIMSADIGNATITKNAGGSKDVISAPISLASNLTVNNLRTSSATTGTITLSGDISSSSSTNNITITGANVFGSGGRSRVFLTGNNSFAGGVVVGATADTALDSGFLGLTNGSESSIPLGTGALIFNTGEIDFSVGNTITSYANNIVLNNTDPSSGAAGAWFQTGATTGSTTLSGLMSGPGGYVVLRKGDVTVNNDSNSFASYVDLDDGVLSFTSIADTGVNSSLGAGSLIKIASDLSSTLKYIGAGNSSTNRNLKFSETAAGNRTATFDQSGTGSITYNGPTEFTANGNLIVALTGSTSGLGTMASVLADGTGKVTSVSKDGTGTWVLSGANTYSGTTAVNQGTLLVNGTHSAAGNYTIASGATLGGGGSIGSNVILQSGSNVAPGTLVGNLTITGNLDASAGGQYGWQLGALSAVNPGTDFDRLTVGGTVTLGGTSALSLDFNLLALASRPGQGNTFWNAGHTWKVLDAAPGSSTNFASVIGAAGPGSWTTTIGTAADDGDILLRYVAGDIASSAGVGVPDAFVGGDDLNVILAHWGQSVTIGDLTLGDLTGPAGTPDGFVGGDDLNIILANWGKGPAAVGTGLSGGFGAAITAVPEPSTFILGALGLVGLCVVRKRRK